MVDYYQIVQRSVAALKTDTEATRQALYERARAALAKQLCLKNPPLSNDSIRAELSALEEAIAKVESGVWSERYEIKGKKEIAGADKKHARTTRSAVFSFAPTALLLAASVAYLIVWTRFSDSGNIAAVLFLLLVFALPAAFAFIFVIHPILAPLLWVMRWLNRKLLRRFVGSEVIANAAGATILAAVLCAVAALKVPTWFSWWTAGWCWFGCAFLLTLDPGIIVNLRSWLRRVQRRKAQPAGSRETPANEGATTSAIDKETRRGSSPQEAPESVAA